MSRDLSSILVYGTLVLLVLSVSGSGQTSNSLSVTRKIEDTRITLNLKEEPLSEFFDELINRYDLVIGFEESDFDENHDNYQVAVNFRVDYSLQRIFVTNSETPKYIRYIKATGNLLSVCVKDAKLSEVLDLIVGQMSFYDWEINNGVINIFPINGRNSQVETLLKAPLTSFQEDPVELWALLASFVMRPEFQSHLKANRIAILLHKNSDWEHRKLSEAVSISNMSVKEALNQIVLQKRGAWHLKPLKENEKDKERGVRRIQIEF